VIDDSLSVDRAAVATRWQQLAGAVRSLPPSGQLSVLRFAAQAPVELDGQRFDADEASRLLAMEAPPRTRPLDPSETNVEGALHEAFARAQLDRPAVIVLLTDGAETQGDAVGPLRALRDAAISVIAMSTAPPPAAEDASIAHLDVPAEARVGDLARLSVEANGRTPGNATISLRLDGTEVARRAVELTAVQPTRVDIELPLRAAGPHVIRAHVERVGDPRPENDWREAVIEVEGPPRVTYVTVAPSAPPLLQSLRAGGWDVSMLAPPAFAAQGAGTAPPALIVLDDVALDDMTSAEWRALDTLVRYAGTGLIVLGGPRSFGAGGYRGSILEDLLPVIAEGADAGRRAAILFVIDSSGSMETDRDGRPRLDLARRALLETLRAIPDDDLVGVTSFALEAREVVPLGRHGRLGDTELSFALPAASGGTRLGPALRDAVDRLSRAEAEQRLLVLLTDGFTPEEDLAPIERALADADIQVIALAVGRDVRLQTLEDLARHTGGSVLRVDDSASLPRLMRREVGERRAPAELGVSRPRAVSPLPFALARDDWPPVRGYMVSRARPGAAVYLESERGAPLLAAHFSGAGRVGALPGGLGGWANAWYAWPQWGPFVGGLARWLARPAGHPRLHLHVADSPRGLDFEVDAVAGDDEWAPEAIAHATALDPAGSRVALDRMARAPGRFAGTLPAVLPGLYRVAVRVGEESAVRHVLRSTDRELRPPARDPLQTWHADGLVTLWPEHGTPPALVPHPIPTPLRTTLVLMALALYIASMAWEERGPVLP
jgi:Mg-chelatase subunit ChlD